MDLFSLHLKNAVRFLEYLKTTGLAYSYDEILDKTSGENYERVQQEIDRFNKICIPDTFLYIPESATFDVSIYILNEIFGTVISQNVIDELSRKIIITNKSDAHNGSVVLDVNSNKKKLLFDRLDTTASIPVFTHEVVHYLFDDTTIFTNIHTLEILSILMEFIAADFIEERKIDNVTKKATFASRVEELKHTRMIITKYYPYYKTNYKNDKTALNIIKTYAEHTSYQYTYSFIVAYNLFLMYKEDRNRLICELRNLIENKKHINILMDYYNINLENTKCRDNVINLMRSL